MDATVFNDLSDQTAPINRDLRQAGDYRVASAVALRAMAGQGSQEPVRP